MASIAATFVIFGSVRMLAGPAPDTMTKEYQEASNEFLKVLTLRTDTDGLCLADQWLTPRLLGTKFRPHHRSLFRGLLWQGHGPVSSQELNRYHLSLSSLESQSQFDHGSLPMYKTSRAGMGWGACDVTRGQPSAWCKYCTKRAEFQAKFHLFFNTQTMNDLEITCRRDSCHL